MAGTGGGASFELMLYRNGSPVGTVTKLNIADGTNVTTSTDLNVQEKTVTLTINSSGGGGGTPASTVTDETTFTISPAVGTSTNFAREDHTHGSEPHDSHANLSGVTADQHHAQSHTLVSHSTRPHSDLTGVGANDHHAQAHSGSDHTDPAAPTTAVFGDVAAAGTGTLPPANEDHKHGMPANPVTAHEAASDPHTGYLKESNTIDFLVGTATAELAGEIVVGATPGGELGGSWASPTVDATHSGSAHHAEQHAMDSATFHTSSDITTLNADLTKHGFMQKYPGGTTTFLRADGSFAAPTAAAADPSYSPGSFTIVTETGRYIPNHLKLTSSQRATLQGTGRLRLTN